MFLQRVRSASLIIEWKLGLTSLHDFVVRQIFCILVTSVKGSHGSKGCRFSCLRYNFAPTRISLSGRPFLYDTLSRSRAGGVWYQEVEIFFKLLQRILMLEEVFYAPGRPPWPLPSPNFGYSLFFLRVNITSLIFFSFIFFQITFTSAVWKDLAKSFFS